MDTTQQTEHPTSNGASTGPVQRFLDQLSAGAGIDPHDWDDRARLDATVPNWRFALDGPEAVTAQLSRWYAVPTTIDSLRRRPVPGGEVVEVDLSWVEDGVPFAAHQVHLFELVDGRIVADTFFCGGRWSAALLAEMEDVRAS
jgi:hypothetical protein